MVTVYWVLFSSGLAAEAAATVINRVPPPVTAPEFTLKYLASAVLPGDTVITPVAGIIGWSNVSWMPVVTETAPAPFAGDTVIPGTAAPFTEKLQTFPVEIPAKDLLSSSLSAYGSIST
ncbi:hypothetical protein D3C80_1392700 [compost metagenome]